MADGVETMDFRATLDRHLRAIRNRDLTELLATLPPDEVSLITSDGRLVRTTAEMIEMHRGWFAQTTWSLDTEIVSVLESPEVGVVVLRLEYRDDPPGGPPVREASYLTLVFALRDGRWVMTHDQNTPCKAMPAGDA